MTLDAIGSSRANPPDPLLIQVVGDDQTLKAVQVNYRNLTPDRVTVNISSSTGFSRNVKIDGGTPDTQVPIPANQQPAIILGGPYGFQLPDLAISLNTGQ